MNAITSEDVTPDKIIDIVQRRRLELLYSDADLDKVELKLMADMSITALGSKRILTDDANAAADREIASAITKAISDLPSDPFVKDTNVERVIEVVVPTISTVPDEASTEMANLEYIPDDPI